MYALNRTDPWWVGQVVRGPETTGVQYEVLKVTPVNSVYLLDVRVTKSRYGGINMIYRGQHEKYFKPL